MEQVAVQWLQVEKGSPEWISVRGKETGIEADLLMGKKSVRQSIGRILHKATYSLHTLTFDNDKAFAGHQAIGLALGHKTYFTKPYTSQDKGTVENRIGRIRRFLPKKTDLREIFHYRVRQVGEFLNNRTVRKFKHKTPNQEQQERIALIT